MAQDERLPGGGRTLRHVGLVAGPVAAVAVLIVAPESYLTAAGSETPFTLAGRATLALMAWMATWWLTEAIHISATALLPLAVLPLVTVGAAGGGAAVREAAAPYANPFIALFLGGFLLALAMERWGLHRRIALIALRCVGTTPSAMVGGFMAISAVMSMWVSNTATTIMLLPIALSVVGLAERQAAGAAPSAGRRATIANLPVCLLLGIAYAASVGGIGTLIGTPPNLLLAGFMRDNYGMEISFARWLAVGLPLVAVFVPIIWILLTQWLHPLPRVPVVGGRAAVRAAHAALGRTSRAEWSVFVVFMAMALAWIFRPLLTQIEFGAVQPLAGLTDAGIAVIAALVLFVTPVHWGSRTFVLDWETAAKAPWGILVLFGGGLSLAHAVQAQGVAAFVAAQASGLAGLPGIVIVLVVATGVVFLTELTSNTATTATLLPVLAAVATALGIEPVVLLATAAIAASCAFMMPVATPPNAVVFSSGHLSIRQMCKAGLWLNLIGILLVTVLAYALVARLL